MKKPHDWVEMKNMFTQEQEDAIWQYFIDHSQLQKNGYWGIQFYVLDMNDFWRRLYARYSKQYARYNKLEKESQQQNNAYFISKRRGQKNDKIVNEIRIGNNYWKKFLFWVFKETKNRLFK